MKSLRPHWTILFTLVISVFPLLTFGQERPSVPAESETAEARKKVLGEMRSFVDNVKLYEADRSDRREVPLVEKPVLFFQDTARDNHHGSVWLWGRTGRPKAIIEVYLTGDQAQGTWPGNVMHSLSDTPLVGEARFNWKWQPTKPAFEPKTLNGVAEPQDMTVARQRQIKALATKFSACEYFLPGHTRHELRLLPRPLYEYEDESANILDGALFAFVHGGSNPEALLLIEAIGSATKQPAWQYGFVRLSHAEMHCDFDGKEVWTQQRVEGMQRLISPYFSVIPGPAPP